MQTFSLSSILVCPSTQSHENQMFFNSLFVFARSINVQTFTTLLKQLAGMQMCNFHWLQLGYTLLPLSLSHSLLSLITIFYASLSLSFVPIFQI